MTPDSTGNRARIGSCSHLDLLKQKVLKATRSYCVHHGVRCSSKNLLIHFVSPLSNVVGIVTVEVYVAGFRPFFDSYHFYDDSLCTTKKFILRRLNLKFPKINFANT
ncbi:hypothetical protein BD410DRAFT_787823, partial [Rickenella mellea]